MNDGSTERVELRSRDSEKLQVENPEAKKFWDKEILRLRLGMTRMGKSENSQEVY